MKRFVFLLIVASLVLSGCVTGLLSKIPDHEFESFEYHRTGNFSASHIVAGPAVKEDDGVMVDSVIVTSDWGPVYSVNIKLTGYKRGHEPVTALEE